MIAPVLKTGVPQGIGGSNPSPSAKCDIIFGMKNLREIGRGAYGVVYLAEGPDGGWVAAKVCRREDIGEERYERELRGARLYSAIPPQEGLVRMLELAEEPWRFYVVMELADDEFGRESLEVEAYRPKTLASVIDSVKAMPLAECVKLGITLSKGLAALQQHHFLSDLLRSHVC